MLYLFDEIDTETNKVLLDREIKSPNNSPVINRKDANSVLLDTFNYISDNPDKKITNSIRESIGNSKKLGNDKLSLGTILEEISGINQMYGRKMVFISNYPDKLDKALLRPGRIDHMIKLRKMYKK